MGFIKKLLGMEDVEITDDMKISTLKSKFEEYFGTEIRGYKTLNTGKGSRHADDKEALSNVGDASKKNRKKKKKKSMTVGEVEEKFKEKMGIGIQIMTPDGRKFAPNEMRLMDVVKMKG